MFFTYRDVPPPPSLAEVLGTLALGILTVGLLWAVLLLGSGWGL